VVGGATVGKIKMLWFKPEFCFCGKSGELFVCSDLNYTQKKWCRNLYSGMNIVSGIF
jgi:hypothetical protein